MTTRIDEAFCRDAFTVYLQRVHGVTDAHWSPEPNGNSTPPDFGLTYHGKTYAVEITAIMSQHTQVDGAPISDLGVWNVAERLTEEVEAEMTKRGQRGYYSLTYDGPYHAFRCSLREVKNALLAFIANTQHIEQVPMKAEPLVTSRGQPVFFEKHNYSTTRVVLFTMGGNEGWEFSVLAELSSLVCDAIESKARKLRSVSPPRVLLVLDMYDLATPREYAKLREELRGLAAGSPAHLHFNAIFIVNRRGEVFDLHSVEDPRGCG